MLEQRRPVVTEQAARADDLVDEAIEVGHGRSDPLVTHAKMLRLETPEREEGVGGRTQDALAELLEVTPTGYRVQALS